MALSLRIFLFCKFQRKVMNSLKVFLKALRKMSLNFILYKTPVVLVNKNWILQCNSNECYHLEVKINKKSTGKKEPCNICIWYLGIDKFLHKKIDLGRHINEIHLSIYSLWELGTSKSHGSIANSNILWTTCFINTNLYVRFNTRSILVQLYELIRRTF